MFSSKEWCIDLLKKSIEKYADEKGKLTTNVVCSGTEFKNSKSVMVLQSNGADTDTKIYSEFGSDGFSIFQTNKLGTYNIYALNDDGSIKTRTSGSKIYVACNVSQYCAVYRPVLSSTYTLYSNGKWSVTPTKTLYASSYYVDNATTFTLKAPGNGSTDSVYTLMDLTPYSNVTMNFTNPTNNWGMWGMGISTAANLSNTFGKVSNNLQTTSYLTKKSASQSKTVTTLTMDISDLTGSYYFGVFYANTTNACYINVSSIVFS